MPPKRRALLEELSSDSDDEAHVADGGAQTIDGPTMSMLPPSQIQNTHLWTRMKDLLPERAAASLVRGIDYGSEKHHKLHDEIDEIVRTRGRMNHSELVPLPPPDDDDGDDRGATAASGLSPRPPPKARRSKAGAPGAPTSPSSKSKSVNQAHTVRYLAVKTTAYAPYVPAVYAKAGRTIDDVTAIASFRFSFITLFFVGVACGKFKRLLRRRTLCEQQVRYEEMLKKSIAERHELINKPDAKQYSVARAKDLVQRTRVDVGNKFSHAISQSNQRARMVRLNPRVSLGRHASSGTFNDGMSMPTASPAITYRVGDLGDFLLRCNVPRSSLPGDPQNETMITLVPEPDAVASPVHLNGARVPVPRSIDPSPRSQGCGPNMGDGANGSFTATLETLIPRRESFARDEAPSLHTSTRVVPAFELYSDQNVFVVNTLWDDMEYHPLRDRSKKTLLYQPQVAPSALSAFTQSVLPASSRRMQETYVDAKKKVNQRTGEGGIDAAGEGDEAANNGSDAPQHQLGSVSAFNNAQVASPVALSSPHFATLQAANLDINVAKALVPYEVGQRSVARSYNVVGLRAARSVAKPSAAPFDFYSWRVRQNRALFHHLCQEHRELIQDGVATGQNSTSSIEPTPSSGGGGSAALMSSPEGGGAPTAPQDHDATPGTAVVGPSAPQIPLSAKDLQALRERVRRRAEEVEFNADDSASRTYDAFVVHKELEHVAFLRNTQAEVDRLLNTKDALSGDIKHKKLLEMIDRPDAGGNLVERFKWGIGQLERGIRKDLEKATIEENEQYNRSWMLTMAHRVATAFGGRLPPEGDVVVQHALATAQRCSHRDLTMQDLEEGVVQALDVEEMVSASAQFMLERLLPAFSSSPTDGVKSPVDAKLRLRAMFAKRRCPYVLLSPEDEREYKERYGLSDEDKERRNNVKALRSVERLNGVMEPHFEKLALAALNTVESRHAAMRLEHRRLRDQMAKSEDDALVKAATLDRRRGSKAGVGGAGDDGRRRSTTVALSLGLDSISPTAEKARRASRRESLSFNGASEDQHLSATNSRHRLQSMFPGGNQTSPRGQPRRPSHASIMLPHPPSSMYLSGGDQTAPPPVSFRRNSFGGGPPGAMDSTAGGGGLAPAPPTAAVDA